MKIIINVIFIYVVFLTGCSQKENVVIYKAPVEENKQKQEVISEIITEKKEMPIILEEFEKNHNKIALVYATNKIGKYSLEALNISTTYLSMIEKNYSFFAFDMEEENSENYNKILENLHEQNINNVIFLVTDSEINTLLSHPQLQNINCYFPLINKNNLSNPIINNKNVVFGGINYNKQFETIVGMLDINKTTYEIYDDKTLSVALHEKLVAHYPQIKSINLYGKNPNYEEIFKRYDDMNDSNIILNTSVIKSSIVLSQIRANDLYPFKVYSTQINYTPLIFALTQDEDRKNLVLISSIGTLPKNVYSQLVMSENDVRYNWVNYSTLVGLEYLIKPSESVFGNKIEENQIIYTNDIIEVQNNQFLNINSIE